MSSQHVYTYILDDRTSVEEAERQHGSRLYFDFAHARYKEEMEKLTASSPGSIDPHTLQEHHEKSIYLAIKLISEAVQLTDEQINHTKQLLDQSFSHYHSIYSDNQEKTGPAIGIDLGTTSCCMAVLKGVSEIPEVIPCDAGDLSKTPTYITFPFDVEDEDDDGYEINFGEFAKRLAFENPKGTIFDLKRMLGRKFNDPRIQRDRQFWPFDIIDVKGEIKVKTGPNTSKYPSEIMAEYIKWLKRAADDYLGYRVDSAVVTVPVYFNQHQRELTTQACEQAGLRVLQFVNEPTAAAVAYSLPKISYNSKYTKNCLIFDLGGGTFDLAFLQVIGGQVHVKAIGGDDHLGGEDFDNNLVHYCLQQFLNKHGIYLNEEKTVADPVESMKISKRLRRLKNECEQQKRNLSQAKRVIITLEKIYDDLDLSIIVTREIFDDINKGLFNRCIEVLRRFLQDHNIAQRDIDDVVIVGGSSKIPCIQKMLSDFFGGKSLCKTVDPDKAVALGASSLAFYAENVEVPNILLQDSVSISPTISTPISLPILSDRETQNQGSSRGPTNFARQHSAKPAVAPRPDHHVHTTSVKQNVSMWETKSPESVPIKWTGNLPGQSLPRTQFQSLAIRQNPVFTPIIPPKPHGRLSAYLEPIQFQPVIPPSFCPAKKPDIGIYISCNTFQIGSCKEPTRQSFTELITITPELYFADKEVLVGSKAHAFIENIHIPMNERYFDIFELINSPEIKTHHLNIQGNTFTLCTAHVIAAFFLQVFNLLNICGDGKIILTLPFNKTYSGVEKIRKSLNILGYFNIRILPSLVTTAIASLDTLGFYKNVETEPSFRKFVFVLDVQIDSFSMAILQMLPRGISVISSRRSENTAECQHDGFAQCHANWFKGTEIQQGWKDYIRSVYERLIDPFLAVSLKFQINAKIDAIIINEPKGSSSFANMVKEVLSAKFYNLGIPQIEAKSIFGASLLVSPNLGAVSTRVPQILDPNMQVDVRGLFSKSHVLTTNIEGKVAKIENFTCQKFKMSTEVISKSKKKMDESKNKSTYVLLQETNNQIDLDKASDPGYYECRVEGKIRRSLFQFSRPLISFEINCKQDLDGFFSLSVVKKSDPNFEILLTKKENIICSSVCVSPASSEFERLIAFYEKLVSRKNRKNTL